MNTHAPLTFRSRIKDPFTVASMFSMGLTAVLALHATLAPQYRDIDFAIFLCSQAAFIVYSIFHIIRLRFIAWTRLHHPPALGGSSIPPEGSPVPVPVGPRTPVMRRAGAKELPRPVEPLLELMAVTVEEDRKIGEPGAAPNGGPATQLGNSNVTEGPPSVS